MSDTPIKPGKLYRVGKLYFEHQHDGRWGVRNRTLGVDNRRTPVGALIGLWRTRHGTVRVQWLLTHLRLYRPTMKALHRMGQCFMVTKPGPEGLLRECTWCGNRFRPVNTAGAEASLRKAS